MLCEMYINFLQHLSEKFPIREELRETVNLYMFQLKMSVIFVEF
jgi:hypothetical protein